MVILQNTKTVDIERLGFFLKYMKIDFSMIHRLQGNKELLEKAFQEVKQELL